MMMRTQPFTALVPLFALIGGATIQARTPDTTTPRGAFQPVGDMTTPRSNATATLMADGTVLVAGGSLSTPTGGRNLQTAELFDPATSTFTPVAALMNKARIGHSAVRLRDGRVLIVGGGGFNNRS